MDIARIEDMPIIRGREIVPFRPGLDPRGKLKDWDLYVSDMLACRHIKNAAIYVLQNGDQLATSDPDFKLSEEELKKITEGILLPNLLRENGIQVNGEMYKYHVGDGKHGVMGKAGMPACGVSACRTLTLLLVAVHDAKMKPDICNETVMIMGDFFWAKGL